MYYLPKSSCCHSQCSLRSQQIQALLIAPFPLVNFPQLQGTIRGSCVYRLQNKIVMSLKSEAIKLHIPQFLRKNDS